MTSSQPPAKTDDADLGSYRWAAGFIEYQRCTKSSGRSKNRSKIEWRHDFSFAVPSARVDHKAEAALDFLTNLHRKKEPPELADVPLRTASRA
jgi:hypothetical protein